MNHLKNILTQDTIHVSLIFHIFEYAAEYGAECSTESSAKQYFILIPYLRKEAFRRSSIKQKCFFSIIWKLYY